MWRVVTILVLALAVQPRQVVEPRVSLWYWGMPQGSARAIDLEAARALGFSAVKWPFESSAKSTELIRLADALGLKVLLSDPPVVELATINADRVRPEAVWPLAWRAIARGTRFVSIDPGRNVSVDRLAAQPPKWAAAVAGIERQLRANGLLFAQTHPGPSVVVDRPAPAIDVMLLDAGRSWVVAATNVSERAARVGAHLPAAVPYAMWVNLLDGSTMAMLDEAAGPRWAFDIDAWGVKLYVIDKILK